MKKEATTKPVSQEDRQAIIELWQESGQRKAEFCKEFGINYQTFIGWTCPKKKKPKEKLVESSFVPLAVRAEQSRVFAEVQFEGGQKIYLHREVPASFLRSLLG